MNTSFFPSCPSEDWVRTKDIQIIMYNLNNWTNYFKTSNLEIFFLKLQNVYSTVV